MSDDEEKLRLTFLEVLQINEAIDSQLADNVPFQSLLGLPSSDLEAIKGVAQELFSERKYRDSADVYLFLNTLNPSQGSTWLAMGIAEHLDNQFDRAVKAFSMATWADPSDPVPHLHLADCFVAQGRLDQAVQALSLAINCVGQVPEHAKLQRQAVKLRKALLKRQGKEEEGVGADV